MIFLMQQIVNQQRPESLPTDTTPNYQYDLQVTHQFLVHRWHNEGTMGEKRCPLISSSTPRNSRHVLQGVPSALLNVIVRHVIYSLRLPQKFLNAIWSWCSGFGFYDVQTHPYSPNPHLERASVPSSISFNSTGSKSLWENNYIQLCAYLNTSKSRTPMAMLS